MRMIYDKPRYSEASKKAVEFLDYFNINDFPYSIKKCAKHFDIKITKYSSIMKKTGDTLKDVENSFNTKDGCIIYNAFNKKYQIVYNDFQMPERIKFTIAHELGHYFLNHLKDERTKIHRHTLSDDELDVLEKEANRFARDILAPPYLVREVRPLTPTEVTKYFHISHEFSKNIINYLKYIRDNYNFISYPVGAMETFSKFIIKVKLGQICKNCGHSSYNQNFCSSCGNEDFYKMYNGGIENLNHINYETNEKGLLKECLHCKNENILQNSNFCHICGMPVKNVCTNSESVFLNYIDPYHDEEFILEANARYCHKCGSESSFLKKGLLNSWIIETQDLPF